MPSEGHLDLLLLGRLAVRSAQAYRRQGASTEPQGGLAIGKEYTGGVARTALWEGRTLLLFRNRKRWQEQVEGQARWRGQAEGWEEQQAAGQWKGLRDGA